MKADTIKEMNDVLGIADEVIQEDKDWLAKIEHKPTVTYTGSDDDLFEDYKFARDNLKKLIESGNYALAKIENVLKDSDQARVFEVFAILIKSISDLTTDLITLQKSMKDISTPMNVASNNNDEDNTIEITTDQLNKLLENK